MTSPLFTHIPYALLLCYPLGT